MYQKVFESKILLVYGISGTGKTSLINCGLANKFEDSDWLPVYVRRGRNILDSLERELGKVVLSDFKSAVHPPSLSTSFRASEGQSSPQSAIKDLTPGEIVKALQSIYLDHFKPIYLIFDQLEELFIFGDREEREEFIQIVKAVVNSDVQCRFIFSIREEYLAGVTEFERLIPEFLANRMRIEKMTSQNAIQVIEGPCKVQNIEVEEGFPEALLQKLNPDSNEVELTYLQVFLDKIYRLSTNDASTRSGEANDTPRRGVNDDPRSGSNNSAEGTNDNSPLKRGATGGVFTIPLLDQVGDVTDLLGSFLEEQISALDDPDTGLAILKSFVSIKGTKKQITEEEVLESSRTYYGKDIPSEILTDHIQRFVNLRILRDKDESGRYELRHDSLADKIYEKITLVEKEILEVRQFVDNAYSNYMKRGIPLNTEDLTYIAHYEERLFLKGELSEFITKCRKIITAKKRNFNRILRYSAIGFFFIIFAVAFYYIRSSSSVKSEKLALEASMQRDFDPGLSFNTALEAYEKDTTYTLAVKALFDAFYGLLENGPYFDSLGNELFPQKTIFDFELCHSDILYAKFSEDGNYIYGYLADNTVKVWNRKGKEVFSEKGNDTSIIALNFAPNNKYISALDYDSTAIIWDLEGNLICSLKVYYDSLNPFDVINFSPNKDIMTCIEKDHQIRIYDMNGNFLYDLKGHKAPVNGVVFSPDGNYISSASKDSTVIIWQLDSVSGNFKRFRDLNRFQNVVWSVDFSRNSNYVLCASTDTLKFPYTCRIYNFNRSGHKYWWACYDTTYLKNNPFAYSSDITGKVISADFTKNDAAIIIRTLNEGRLYLTDQDSNLDNQDYISYRIRTAYESNWKLMSRNKILKRYHWTEDEIYQYGGIDMSVNDYIASNISGSKHTNLFHWDRMPIRKFRGIKPNFSPDGEYLLCINGNSILLYPADEKEIIRLVNEEAIFGKPDKQLNSWLHIFDSHY